MQRTRFLCIAAIGWMLLNASSHAASLEQTRESQGSILDSQFFAVNGVTIHYFTQGRGEPVVLIHGWLASAKTNWVNPGTMAYLVNNHYRVVALDLAGYGASDTPNNPAAYGDAWVEQVLQLMNHLDIDKAHIVGYSMGGMVALKFIVNHPERAVSGLLGGMGYLEEGSAQQKKWAAWSKPQWSGVARLALSPAQLSAVKVPIAMVLGSRDPTLKTYVAPLLRVRTDWPVVELPGDGHLTTVGSQEFKDAILSWVTAHPSHTIP